jgi:hypothetical protein
VRAPGHADRARPLNDWVSNTTVNKRGNPIAGNNLLKFNEEKGHDSRVHSMRVSANVHHSLNSPVQGFSPAPRLFSDVVSDRLLVDDHNSNSNRASIPCVTANQGFLTIPVEFFLV